MKWLTIIYLMVLGGCKVTSIHLQVKYDNVKSISIESVSEKKTTTIENKNVIDSIFSEYINRNKREIRKFVAQYRITVKYPDKEELYIVNGKYLNYNGITYEMEKNLGEFLTSLK